MQLSLWEEGNPIVTIEMSLENMLRKPNQAQDKDYLI